MFWGREKLCRNLRERIDPFCEQRVDGASYRLSIGEEIYVSPTTEATDPTTASIRRLNEGEAFAIPPGQFAFLLTQESVTVCCCEIAFISIRAKTKFRGLVNVSGFHVDPGYKGRLTFAVFNAGPVAIHLRRGQEIFLIWYADLDSPALPKEPGSTHIESGWINGIGGKLHSLSGLASSINGVENRMEKKLEAVARELAIFRVIAAIAVTALVGLVIRSFFG